MQTDLHRIASRFLGLREIKGQVHNPQILAMLKLDNIWPQGDEIAWCSAFVNYVCWILDVPRSRSLAARSWLSVGAEVKLTEALRGRDIVVLSRGDNPALGHVGFFHSLDGLGVEILGGNQNDMVNVDRFPIARVVGVRRLITLEE